MILLATPENVAERGGVFFGTFSNPIAPQESARFFSFRAPDNQLRYEQHYDKRITVFSLPHSFPLAKGKAALVAGSYAA